MDATRDPFEHPDWITHCPNPSKWLERLIPSMKNESECWPWVGHLDLQGYGVFRYVIGGRRRHTGAHRAAYLTFVGDIGPDLTLDHLCRNTACVNPAHLEPVPSAVNVQRGFDFRRGGPKSPPVTKPDPLSPFVLPTIDGQERLRDMLEAVTRVQLVTEIPVNHPAA